MECLSSKERPEIIKQLKSRQFDLLVIGGGITGAGIALDGASRGMKTALVEMSDFASGTSSKSTKLIHGGLRYLKQLEIALVREAGRERAIVHRLAPNLVTREKMLLPLVKGGTYGELTTSMGLWVYDVLAGVQGTDKRIMLSKEETIQKEPLLRKDIVTGGGYYAEYRTDDARLTIENIKTATHFGALGINYVKAEEFLYQEDGSVCGVKCREMHSNQSFEIRSHFVVSAAGPWVDQLRNIDGSAEGKRLFLSKGVHIVVPHQRFPVRQAAYFDIPDGRMIFAIPRQRVTYIGTTDTPFNGDINHIPVYREDVEYLLNAANYMFPEVNLSIRDIESSWAGLRPLIFEEGKSASEMSRKDEIFESGTGLLSIAGGKLTGYRKMAERIVDLVAEKYEKKLNRKFRNSFTDNITLSGGPFGGAEEVGDYISSLTEKITSIGLEPFYAEYLVANYGRQSEIILEKMPSFTRDTAEMAIIRAEAWFSTHHELAWTLNDFFNRRSGRLYFNLPSIGPAIRTLAADFAQYLNWDEHRLNAEIKSVEIAIRQVTEFEYGKQAIG